MDAPAFTLEEEVRAMLAALRAAKEAYIAAKEAYMCVGDDAEAAYMAAGRADYISRDAATEAFDMATADAEAELKAAEALYKETLEQALKFAAEALRTSEEAV
jgi:hypothetical protein